MRNLEDILHDVGGAGLFQLAFVTFTCVPRMWISWSMLEMSFANYVPRWCCLPSNVTEPGDHYCLEDDSNATFAKDCIVNDTSCESRVFATVVNEWDLVCERKWMLPLTTSVQMAGVLVGALIAGQMSNLTGRKKTLFLSCALCSGFSICAGFSVNWEMFSAFRFLIGMTIGGYLAVSNMYIMEFLSAPKRKLFVLNPTWQIGAAWLAFVAWRLEDWRWVHWVSGIAMMPCLLGYFLVPESMRWLAVNNRVDEAQKVIEWIARWNRRQVPKDSLEVIKFTALQRTDEDAQKKYTYIHLYKGWHLFKTSIIVQTIWLILSMCYYGISFGASSLGLNMYLNIFLISCVSLPFLVVVNQLVDRVGRKRTTMIFSLLGSMCSFGSLAGHLLVSDKDTRDIVVNVLNLLSEGFLSAAWSTMMFVSTEAYPTVIRGLGFGAANVVARVGGILAPEVLNIEDMPAVSFGIIGGSLLVCAILVLFLDETAGKAMPDITCVVQSSKAHFTKETQQAVIDGITEQEKQTHGIQEESDIKEKDLPCCINGGFTEDAKL